MPSPVPQRSSPVRLDRRGCARATWLRTGIVDALRSRRPEVDDLVAPRPRAQLTRGPLDEPRVIASNRVAHCCPPPPPRAGARLGLDAARISTGEREAAPESRRVTTPRLSPGRGDTSERLDGGDGPLAQHGGRPAPRQGRRSTTVEAIPPTRRPARRRAEGSAPGQSRGQPPSRVAEPAGRCGSRWSRRAPCPATSNRASNGGGRAPAPPANRQSPRGRPRHRGSHDERVRAGQQALRAPWPRPGPGRAARRAPPSTRGEEHRHRAGSARPLAAKSSRTPVAESHAAASP